MGNRRGTVELTRRRIRSTHWIVLATSFAFGKQVGTHGRCGGKSSDLECTQDRKGSQGPSKQVLELEGVRVLIFGRLSGQDAFSVRVLSCEAVLMASRSQFLTYRKKLVLEQRNNRAPHF
ncbi:MAG: hypothetical protein ACYCYP_09080 [Leptospirales bacterium]